MQTVLGFKLFSSLIKVIAIDGKTLRGSRNGSHTAIHMVSAFASEAGIVLGQVKTQKNLTKSQLFLNYSSGAIVTIDAMGCQKAIAQKIVNKGGD